MRMRWIEIAGLLAGGIAIGAVATFAIFSVGGTTNLATAVKEWLPATTPIVVVIGLVVTSSNVIRTIRMGIFTREEDRIERDLPGLRDTMLFLAEIATTLREPGSGHAALNGLREAYGIESLSPEVIEEALSQRLRQASPDEMKDAVDLTHIVGLSAAHWKREDSRLQKAKETPRLDRQQADKELQAALEAVNERRANFDNALEGCDLMSKQIESRLAKYLERRRRLRAEINRFLDN